MISARDRQRMIAKIKNVSREKVFFDPENVHLNEEEERLLQDMTERYNKDEPLSKILNCRSFWKHDFFVNGDVLDPRPETEILIEAVLKRFGVQSSLNFLDVGTGSGCILLSLLHEYKNSRGIGIDISPGAIDVAKHNREKFEIKNADFRASDWKDFRCEGEIDIVVSNPPYIKTGDLNSLDRNVRNYDPLPALDGGETGLDAYVSICESAKGWLKPGGSIFFEIGRGQEIDVSAILRSKDFEIIEIRKDYGGIARIVEAIRK
ncbi:MAG: peptide chain release factor N(5)-glutamine methyltransferase [Holosporaceae bacterium]|jgi:release factor glutamine methyltransferase|nr:peptide chain release factor N(5)-glutamine methyltransferase [Holosporaceae bacterium]